MAQLKDSIVTGSLRVTDTIYSTNLNLSSLTASYAVITDANKNLTSRAITNNTSVTAVTASTNLITANTLYYHSGNSNIVTVGTVTSGTWSATAINPNKGGTGITSYTKGDLLYAGATIAATDTTALSKLAIGTAGYFLKATANGPAWANTTDITTLGTITTGTWNATTIGIGYGGTGTSTAPTQWGVIYASSTSAYASTGAGTSGYLLQSNATNAPSWIQATNSNTGSTIVKRDASGNFSAGTITATISGNASSATTLKDTRKLWGNDFNGSGDVSGSMKIKLTTIHIDTSANNGNTGSDTLYQGLAFVDNNDYHYGECYAAAQTDGRVRTYLLAKNKKTDGTEVTNSLNVGVAKDGSQVYSVSNPANFRSAISAPSTTGGDASGTWGISVTGNAGTATKLETARNIWGQSFNGTAAITGNMRIDHSITKGTTPTSTSYKQIAFADSTGSTGANYLLGLLYSYVDTSGLSHIRLYNYDNIASTGNATYFGIYHTTKSTSTLVRRTETNAKIYGAVWNDYAEYRASYTEEPGRVVQETKEGKLKLVDERLAPGCRVISDTFGMAIGQTKESNAPIAVCGRVLVYPYRNSVHYQLGAAVCSAPNGTVDIMSREEIIKYPERIIGTVSEIPTDKYWYGGDGTKDDDQKVAINGRIWIYVR